MNDNASISFNGGGMILPADTPYERELLVAHVEACTTQHGCIRLKINGHHWTITMNHAPRAACVSCSQWPDGLMYPGGSTGRFYVLSGRRAACRDVSCELAQADARARQGRMH